MRKFYLSVLILIISAMGYPSTGFAVENATGTTSKLMHSPAHVKWQQRGSDYKMSVVEADTPNGQAIKARIKKKKQRPWEIALWFDLRDGAVPGEEIEMRFWARTAKAPKSKETAEIIAFVGRNEEPYDAILSEEIMPSDDWQLFTITGIAERDFDPGKIKAEFQLGKNKQSVEIGPVYISSKGQAQK